MANTPIKYIALSDGNHEIYDEYARRRLEGLTVVYTISSAFAHQSGYAYTDWDTGETVAYDKMTVKNSAFASTSEEISVSGVTTGTNAYLVLTSTKSANNYYVKHMALNESTGHPGMNIGDTIYVIETAYPDRWLSSVIESPLSAVFHTLESKIDLKEYAKKTEAGKAGTYATADGGEGATGSAGSQTATGTATVTYKKADTATGSAGSATITSSSAGAGESANTGNAGGVTVNGSNFSFNGTAATVSVEADAVTLDDHSYTPAGSLSGTQSIAAHSHTVNVAKATVNYVTAGATVTNEGGSHNHTVSGSVTAEGSISVGTGTANYTPAGTISAVSAASHTHTISVNTTSITPITSVDANTGNAGEHSHTVDSHTHGTDVTVVTGVTAASLTGTTSFNTDAIKSASLATDSSTTPAFAFNTDAIKSASLTGTTSFNTDAIKDVTLSASTTSTDGPAYISDVSHTAASLTGTTTFNTDAIKTASLTGTTTFATGFNGTANYGFSASQSNVMTSPTVSDAGVLSWTVVNASTQDALSTSAVGITTTAASTASVGISGGSISKTTKYMKRTLTDATTASVGISTSAATKAGLKITTANASKASVGITGGTASSTASVAGVPSDATLTSSTVAAHSHSVTATTGATYVFVTDIKSVSSAGGFNVTPTFTGTGADLEFTGTSVSLVNGLAATAAGHTHAIPAATTASLTYVSGATTSAAGSATVDFTKATFTGTAATLSHSFTDATVSASMSGTYTPAGTIGGSQTISAHSHSYTKPTEHTHSVTVADHTHSIGLTDTTITGTASVAVSAHTHSIGNHTHNVTIPNCAS